MNVVLLFFVFLFFNGSSYAKFAYPEVSVQFLNAPIPYTVTYGETLIIPLRLHFNNLRQYMSWIVPVGSFLRNTPGNCPDVPYGQGVFWHGPCDINLIVPGDRVGKIISGPIQFTVSGKEGDYAWGPDYGWSPFSPGSIHLTVIPRCPSMLTIPQQYATANQDFNITLKSYVQYYDENAIGNTPVHLMVTPASQDGLHFDPDLLSIVGSPTRLGNYSFTLSATNSRCQTQPTTLNIMVQANLKDKPVFKINPIIVTAVPKQKYSMNLMELIEHNPGFMVNNQVQFRIDTTKPYPYWLSISPTDATHLEGLVDEQSAGQTVEVTLIASTNTGGDSLSDLTVKVPIAYDLTKKPTINEFTLHQGAGSDFYYDISKHVDNPGRFPFELTIDKIEPQVSWITHDQTTIHGQVPTESTGEKLYLTLRVSTLDGGPSKPVIVPLHVDIDKEKTPYFKSKHSVLRAIPGQSFVYDFFENNEVYPDNIPYEIEWAEEESYPHPPWIKLKNNQLIVDEVPDLDEAEIHLYLTIKNIPGGLSKVYEVIFSRLFNSPSIRTTP